MPNRILVLSRGYETPVIGLGEITFNPMDFVNDPKEFSLVVFTGGADVDPRFYGDTSPKNYCSYSTQRDVFEKGIFDLALKNGILMTGICRGVQFLNVMSGGTMMHHVDRHAGTDHTVEMLNGDRLLVNSYHHQMVIPPENGIVVGWAEPRISDIYIGKNDEIVDYGGKENEIIIFPDTKAFGAQCHPEMLPNHHEAFVFYRHMVETALVSDWNDFIEAYTGENHHDQMVKMGVHNCTSTRR